jgi:hypothetical protein
LQGWIKLHRKIVDHEIWNDVNTFRLFVLLMINASHQDGTKINGIEIKKGQYLRSYSKLAEDLSYKEGRGTKKVAKSTVLRSVNKLVSNGMVSIQETEHGTLFTVLKYQLYQGIEGDIETEPKTEDEPKSKRTQNEPRTNPKLKQELKNLRKEEEEEGPQIQPNDLTPFQQIANKFIQRRARGFDLSPSDEQSINRLLQDQIPLEKILEWIDEIFNEYVPRHRMDYIKHFSYCEKGILDRWTWLQNQNHPKVTEFPRKKDNLEILDELARKKGWI